MKPFASVCVLVAIPALVSACAKPNAANIQLRRENQTLRHRIEQLEREAAGARATIASLESRATTVPVLPNDRLAQLFTVHGLQFGRLTGEGDIDYEKPGNEGLKIYVVPVDDQRQPIKAAGAFTVEAFDLALKSENRIGHWEFPLSQARQLWFGQAMLNTYVLPAPWQTKPSHPEITIRVKFEDALTGRTFTEQKVVKVQVGSAATTRP
jgi:hypothetical protein